MWILGRQKHSVHNSFQEALNKRYQTLFKNSKRPYFILQFYLAHIVFQSACSKNEWVISLWQTAHNLCGNRGKPTMTTQWQHNELTTYSRAVHSFTHQLDRCLWRGPCGTLSHEDPPQGSEPWLSLGKCVGWLFQGTGCPAKWPEQIHNTSNYQINVACKYSRR